MAIFKVVERFFGGCLFSRLGTHRVPGAKRGGPGWGNPPWNLGVKGGDSPPQNFFHSIMLFEGIIWQHFEFICNEKVLVSHPVTYPCKFQILHLPSKTDQFSFAFVHSFWQLVPQFNDLQKFPVSFILPLTNAESRYQSYLSSFYRLWKGQIQVNEICAKL